MLSVVIPTRNHELRLVRTLAALVPAVAEGLVRDVTVADAGSTDETRVVADAAGCGILAVSSLELALAEAAPGAKCDWILLVAPGVMLEEGWHHEAAGFVARQVAAGSPRSVGLFRLRREEPGLRARMHEALATLATRVTRRPGAAQPVLLRRELARAGGRDGRIVWLRSRAYLAG